MEFDVFDIFNSSSYLASELVFTFSSLVSFFFQPIGKSIKTVFGLDSLGIFSNWEFLNHSIFEFVFLAGLSWIILVTLLKFVTFWIDIFT